ncbi:MAG: MFS transporter, partial [Candidatus Magasanikbacteria bacterium]|nr:MFS transporter [Candidatus Magasanikbacteria bacterium]
MEDSKKMAFSQNTWWLSIMSFLNDVSSEMIQPVLPFFLISVLSLSKGDVGLIEGLAAAVTSFFLWYSGVWSDRVHARKKIVVFGYTLSAFTKPLFGVVMTPWQAALLRVLDRSGKGLRDTPRDALISESTDRAHRGGSFGLNRAFDMLGRVIGSLLVLYILRVLPVSAETYRFIFKISFFPAIIGVVLIILFVRDRPAAR